MNELALFAGAGGGILGGKLLGWRTVCAVERDAYAAAVLAQRQNDGLLEAFPIWSDVTTFDGKPWRGIVDVISGGFPCQDISSAGRGAGITGERSGLWKEFARIIGEVQPRFVFVENSPMLTSRGLGVVLGDLASLGYDAEWGVVSAENCGAPHKRDRIWIVADTDSKSSQIGRNVIANEEFGGCWTFIKERGGKNGSRLSYSCKDESMADTDSPQREREQFTIGIRSEHPNPCGTSWWNIEPDVGRVANGVAARVDRLKAIGNGQVPIVAATAFRILTGES